MVVIRRGPEFYSEEAALFNFNRFSAIVGISSLAAAGSDHDLATGPRRPGPGPGPAPNARWVKMPNKIKYVYPFDAAVREQLVPVAKPYPK